MKSIKNYNRIPTLLSKALLGTLSEQEEEQLKTWRENCQENDRLYKSMMSAEYIAQKSEEVARVNIVEGYLKVLRKQKRSVRVRWIRRVTAIAAGILFPLFIIALWLGGEEESGSIPEEVAGIIRHGEAKAELILEDGTTRFLGVGGSDSLVIQRGANIVVQNRGLSYQVDSFVREERYNTFREPRGGEYSIILCDGTKVYLNSESALRYPVSFVGPERKVYLTGEAYFDVIEDREHPFSVEVNGSVVKVLGTSFDVRAYRDEDEVLTTLVEGSVLFTAGDESVVLVPGEQAVLDKSGRVKSQKVDPYLYTAWREGVFAFKQQRLEEIMRVVARWYDVNIIWESPSQKEVTFTGKMKRYEDFSKVVEMLEMTGNTEFAVKGNNIYIRER